MTDAQLVLLADVILVVHFLIAVFNAFSLPVIWLGAIARWSFVHNPWFRFSHVGLMGFVAVEALAGQLCPLTIWEGMLRMEAGEGWAGSGQTFIGYWVGRMLFHDFSHTQYTVAYSLFFALIILTLFLVPVRRKGKNLPDSSTK